MCSSVTVCVLLLLISIKVTRDVYLYVGITSVTIKTEAGSNDVTECQRNDKPSTGMFAVSGALLSVFICVCNFMYSQPYV